LPSTASRVITRQPPPPALACVLDVSNRILFAELDVYGNAVPPAAQRAVKAAAEAEAALLALPAGARAFFAARILAGLEEAVGGK